MPGLEGFFPAGARVAPRSAGNRGGFRVGTGRGPTFNAGATNRIGPGRGLVGRPQVLALNQYVTGPALMQAMEEGIEARTLAIAAAAPVVEVRFGATHSRSAVENATIGLAHALQRKSAGFLETARRANRVRQGKDPDEVGVRTVPTRNPWYLTNSERQGWRHAIREGLLAASRAGDAAMFTAAFVRAVADHIVGSYRRHILMGRLLRTSSRFAAEGEAGSSVTPLSEDYAKRKALPPPKGVGFTHPILLRSGQLIDSLTIQVLSHG